MLQVATPELFVTPEHSVVLLLVNVIVSPAIAAPVS